MKFKIDDNMLLCYSDSGAIYKLTEDRCSCPAFAFGRGKDCKHLLLAKEKGFTQKLKLRKNSTILNSPIIREARKRALALFLKKNKIKSTQSILTKLEKVLTKNSKPSNLLAIAKKG